MIKREFVYQNEFFFDEIPASNDIVFCTKAGLAAHTIGVDYHVVYCITVTKGSLTRTKTLKNFSSRFLAYSRCNAVLRQNGYRKIYSMGVFALKARKYGMKPLLHFLFIAAKENNFYVANRFRKEIRYR